MRMPLFAGRTFTPSDKQEAIPQPMIVNEQFVRRFLGSRNPIGARLGRNGEREVVGVVSDSYYRSLREEPFLPLLT
jgi:hypothetical protein